jgi:hypothetical protein
MHRGHDRAAVGRFVAVAARLLPGKRLWNDTSPAEVTRQAGDQGFCGVEVRGFEPLASSRAREPGRVAATCGTWPNPRDGLGGC